MPAELLLPLFALVLGLNALLVVAAMRSLWRNRDSDAPRTWSSPVVGRSTERPVVAMDVPSGLPAQPIAAAEPSAPPIESLAAASDDASVRVRDRLPARQPDAPSAPDAVKPARPAAPTTPGAKATRAPRRRFALPQLGEDDEKVNRSIETFLGGGEVPDGGAPPIETSVVTVVVIAVVPSSAEHRVDESVPSEDGSVDHAATKALQALLERTVRSTARTADRVSVDRGGRVRITLFGTGELAAHAYLRRIRTIVEPIVRSSAPPATLVFATATDPEGLVAAARRRVDRRFLAALEVSQPATDEPLADPASLTANPRASDG